MPDSVDVPSLSIVVPVFNEEEVLALLFERLTAVMDAHSGEVEVLLVNDGSTDGSPQMLARQCAADSRFKLVDLSRNFGHIFAITAGLDFADGDAVVVMDADLQDPPELIPEMLARHREGFDIVHAKRRRRMKESLFKRATARIYTQMLRWVTRMDIPSQVGEFRLVSREVVLALRELRERNRLVRGMIAWVGFKQTLVEFDRPARAAGRTKYTLPRMLRLAFDGLTSFSVLPLRLASFLGLITLLGGAVYAVRAIYIGWYLGEGVPGWTSLVILQTLFSSCILICLGLVGEYVGRIFDEAKERPLYIVKGPPPQRIRREDEP